MRRRRLELILDLTSRCNIRCIMCYFSNTDRLRFKPFDLDSDPRGNMSMKIVDHIAAELFPIAHKVGLGCAAEPLLHPNLRQILEHLRDRKVPNTWIQTNLLTLNDATAETIVTCGVRTVAVSIDGTSRNTYERIRQGASWDRLHESLAILRHAREAAGSTLPRLRITFAWMRSNREELASLPPFAAGLGASEIDVRFVSPTVGVDNSNQLLDSEDPEKTMATLWSVARDATNRGIRLSAFPAMDKEPTADNSLVGRLRRRRWLLRSGIDSPQRWRRSLLERLDGCSFPRRLFLIRPNGAVLPCPFWDQDPVALVPQDDRRAILRAPLITDVLSGLRSGCPIGSCRTCDRKKDALFRPTVNRDLAER